MPDDNASPPSVEEHGGVMSSGPCDTCHHAPACGFASEEIHGQPEKWYCHDDDHSCYEGRSTRSTIYYSDEDFLRSLGRPFGDDR